MNYGEGPYDDIRKRNEIREKARRLRKKFLTYKEAVIVHSLSHKTLLHMCTEAGALYYRKAGTVLIDRDIFDEYLK